jgi:ribosomal protein S18 acetylase RimI-like enzyme
VYTENGKQVGFARLVTDYTTFAYLCDVYVLEKFRRLSLGKALIAEVENHPVLKRVRRALLATRDAHGLYAAHGFGPLAAPERFMEINRPGLYVNGRVVANGARPQSA